LANFSHLTESNTGVMVDVSTKQDTVREATVQGLIKVNRACSAQLNHESFHEIATTARIAGITAAKRTSELIPYCHPLNLAKVDVRCTRDDDAILIVATAKTCGKTGVEMEALVAAQIAAATIYDMVKAVSPEAAIGPFLVTKKTGGKSGEWVNQT
jgi:cyclic pyranopterin phosphate synthase